MHSVFVPDFSHSFLLPRFHAHGVLGEEGLGFNVSLYSMFYLSIYFSNFGNREALKKFADPGALTTFPLSFD